MAERATQFAVGSPVVWRSRPAGAVGYVCACRVVLDEPDVIALFQPTGAPVSPRIGTRAGPRGRSFGGRDWDGTRSIDTWGHPPTVRLHPVGKSYSVIRTWVQADQEFKGWYVNLEQPWTRTEIGFDSRDDVLDVVVADDLNGCTLKDEDELDFAVESCSLTVQEEASIRRAASGAIEDVERGQWPFDETAWEKLAPPERVELIELPTGWDQP